MNDFDKYVQPVITEFKLESKQQAEQRIVEQQKEQRRIAQDALREREIKEGMEAYRMLKREENRAYRENESTIEHQSDKKLSRDDDNDFSM